MKRWTGDEINYLKKNWGKVSIENMKLDRSRNAIYVKALKLNLGSNNKSVKRTWAQNELEYLMDSWGVVSMAAIAKKLKRTKGAVQQKASKLGLGPFLEAGDYVTLNQLFIAVKGNDNGGSYTLKQWIDKGLPVKKRKVKNCSFNIIYLQDWWIWAEINRTLIDFSKMEPLVLGKEPKWLEDQRKADTEKTLYFKTSPWAKNEDKLLRALLNLYKYTYRELSLRLKRTEGAIKRRMVDLKIKARPLKMPSHTPWTKEETKTLISLYHKGHTPSTMANYITRSAQACSGKIERLIKEGQILPRSEHRASC